MIKYEIKCRLIHEYLTSSSFKRSIEYNFESFAFEDSHLKCNIEIKPEFTIHISNLICPSYDVAISKSKIILEDLCKSLSLLIQISNYDVREFQPNITFRPYDIKVLSQSPQQTQISIKETDDQKEILVSEAVVITDLIANLQIRQDIPVENAENLYIAISQNEKCELLIDPIYRALKCKDIESKYFTLFTIIEMIETRYAAIDTISETIFNEEQQKSFADDIKPFLGKIGLTANQIARIRDRFLNIIRTATVMSRAEKLSKILADEFEIKNIRKGLIAFDTNKSKMQLFIDARNKLFHGKKLDETEYNNMIQRTNEILALCERILMFELS